MRRLLLVVVCALFVGTAFAQDEAGKIKNEANTALRAKNYQEAFPKLEQYLKLVDYKDDDAIFNAGYSAFQIKNYTAALSYLRMSLPAKYRFMGLYNRAASAMASSMLGSM